VLHRRDRQALRKFGVNHPRGRRTRCGQSTFGGADWYVPDNIPDEAIMLARDPNLTNELLPGGRGVTCRECSLGGVNWPKGCPSRERRVAAGGTLIEQGEAPLAVMLLKEGLVGLCTVGDAGVELGCTVRGPVTLLGLESIFEMRSTYRVWALTDLLLCEAPIARLGPWMGPLDTPLGALMRLGVEEANRRVTERLDFGGDAVSRIARLLLRQCVDLQRSRLELSQRIVARVLSMTPETVSRALARLHASGAVATTRPIAIGDIEQLRRFAQESMP
jgi:CRP-like cAMP-binding protein